MPQAITHETKKPRAERGLKSVSTVSQQAEGNNILSEQDQWLLKNPETLAAIKRGLADSAAGRGVEMNFLE